MADLEEPGGLGKRKHRRSRNPRKLLVDTKVEVRSLEDGFAGSWHPGIVTACEKQGFRQVQYDDLLYDDESGNLVDVVSVSPILDGIGSFTRDCNYRGNIRPIPPQVQPGKWDLPYGLCVDVYHDDAWWEGVIFDHEDGSVERRIFFPDLGDELKARIDTLRVTHDWDEVTEKWKRRGTWIFLELLEQYDQEMYIAVSVKQIWYDVREKEGFENVKEWTSPKRHLWDELVLEVIDDNISITVDGLFGMLDKSGFLSLETQVELDSSHFVSDAYVNHKDSLAIVSIDYQLNSDLLADHGDAANNVLNFSAEIIDERHVNGGLCINQDSACTNQVEEKYYRDQLISAAGDEGRNMNSLSASPSNLDGNSCTTSVISSGGIPNTNSRGRSTANWLPLNPHAKFCPDAVDEYAKGMTMKFTATVVRQHLSHLGWKMDYSRDKGKFRYLSPDGEYKYSLRQVCRKLKKPKKDTLFSISQDAHQGFHSSAEQHLLIEQAHESQHSKWRPLNPVAKFCPDAVDEYADLVKGITPKFTANIVWQHLSYLGWKIQYSMDEVSNKKRHRYLSPDGECEYSLRQVCKKLQKPKKDTLSSTSPCSKVFIFKPEYCPEAVEEYYLHAAYKYIKKNPRKMISKAKKHLSAVGWVFSYANTKASNLRYRSPKGIEYRTLRSACKSCMDEAVSEKRPAECMYVVEEDEGQLTRNKICSAASNLDIEEGLVPSKPLSKKRSRDSVSVSQLSNLVELGNVKVQGSRKRKRKTNYNLTDLAPHLLQRQPDVRAKKYGSIEELIGDEKLGCQKDQCASPLNLKRRKGTGALNGLRNGLDGGQPTRVLRSSKRVQEVVTPTSLHNNPRTVLSWLIESSVVFPRAKVSYRSTKDSHPIKEGRITREGIKCSCCQEVYTLSCFGSHAGRSYHRPSANIFLEDGRSLLDCQMQIMLDRRKRSSRKEPRDRIMGNWHPGENDYICTVCHYGGDLILCDQCPSSFHQSCLGLKNVPDGDWFCASCRCAICGQINFKEDKELTVDDSSVLTCGQCEHKYHKGCLRKGGADKLESDPKGNWFCSKNCKEIFVGLEKLLGKQIPVGDGNLSWSLLKFNKCDSHDTDEPDIDDLTESYSRLNVALDVMHECFLPVKEPLTRRDLVEDVIFSRRSDLNRLNFQGFYTVILERNDELITVATVRIFGDKVAEIPLVGTRFQYRRLRMCRILMDELEKMLMDLGVERLVLPAVLSVLNTWKTSFGFSEMTPSERQQFLDCTFLDFQGTTMCQKLLMKNPPAEASPSKMTQLDLCGDICRSRENTDLDGSSAVSEVYQAEQVGDSGIVYQGIVNAAGNESRPCAGESSHEFSSLENANHKRVSEKNGNDYCKYYKRYTRKRISANKKPSYAVSRHATLSN